VSHAFSFSFGMNLFTPDSLWLLNLIRTTSFLQQIFIQVLILLFLWIRFSFVNVSKMDGNPANNFFSPFSYITVCCFSLCHVSINCKLKSFWTCWSQKQVIWHQRLHLWWWKVCKINLLIFSEFKISFHCNIQLLWTLSAN